jgi:tetratricopeptide (TPR) repeat protein
MSAPLGDLEIRRYDGRAAKRRVAARTAYLFSEEPIASPAPALPGFPALRAPFPETRRVGDCGIILGRMFHFAVIGLLLASPQVPQADDIAKLEATVRDDPSNGSAWKVLGMALAAHRRSEPAVEAFSRACDLNPKDEDACYFLGRQLFSLSRFQEAVAPFDKAVLAAPRDKLARTHRAAALNQIGNGSPEVAEWHFREAFRSGHGPDQTRADAATDYGAFLFRQARTKEALSALKQAVKIDLGSARAHAELGRVLLHLNRPRESAFALERAVELDRGSAGIRMLLGRAYLALGRTEDGERQLRLGRERWEGSQRGSTVR